MTVAELAELARLLMRAEEVGFQNLDAAEQRRFFDLVRLAIWAFTVRALHPPPPATD